MKEVKKWGFGAAPFKRDIELRNRKALVLLRRFLQNEVDNFENLPDGISCVKGLFSRIIRQDQWDWFTTSLYFDYPNTKELQKIISELSDLRKTVIEQDRESIDCIRQRLHRTHLIQYINNYLEYDPGSESDDQFVYILSRKEEKELLKIGMTKRDVLKRCYEINSATGVVYPFSPRRVFRVNDAHTAEKVVHRALAQWRVRSDREFFLIDYKTACRIIEEELSKYQLLNEKYPLLSIARDETADEYKG